MEHECDASEDLYRVLERIATAQHDFLAAILHCSNAGEPRFGGVFRSWQESLTRIRLGHLQTEQLLLHYLLVPDDFRPWRELPRPTRVEAARCRVWQDRLAGWLQRLHIDTTYRRIADPLDLRGQAVTADLLTDLATVAATCEATGETLRTYQNLRDPAIVEELAFYHLLGPWQQRASTALLDCLRWLAAFLGEHAAL